MRILLLHNCYQIAGGEDVVVQTEKALLEAKGHQVALLEASNKGIDSPMQKAKTAINTIYSSESKHRVTSEIASFSPDIVHVHNFFPILSPSVFYACKEAGIPVVQTLHNYRLLCSSPYLFRDGKVCEDCIGKSIPWPGVVHACYKESHVGSGVIAAMLSVHRAIGTWRMIDRYIAPSEFTRQKFIQGGLPAEQIVIKPNFIHNDPGLGKGQGNYALFVGRLSPEKGIDTLLEAWKHLGEKILLKIVGDGNLSPQVVEASNQLPGVEWLGRQSSADVYELMGDASLLVFPSKWYETFGLVGIEAFARGTPVLASNIGVIADIVDHERTGLLFNPGDPADLAKQAEWAFAHPDEMAQMRQAARAEYEAKYTAERNYQMLMDIYEQAMRNR